MILVRLVFHAKFGKVTDALAGFKQGQQMLNQVLGQNGRVRTLTDLSGPFNTIVSEIELGSLAEWEQFRAKMFASPEFQQGTGAFPELLDSGQAEFYTIEG